MRPTFNDKLIAYFTLFSGLAISGIAEYYSIMGLMAIYPTAIIPIVIMGVVLGIGKISGTVWLKQNWEWSPMFLKLYVLPAIVVLMLITSLGVFGFLSKAHSDQSLVSGDVQSKIAVYDEKIKTAKENIEADRKQLKQMDEAVDQVMGRSTDEKGADKANAIRKSQLRDRSALAKDIEANQKLIATLNDEAAPIRAEVRKVEAEVGPIKYIAHLLYGENPDANILEKAVIWVTVLIVTVLDPLAVVLLLASQYSFQRFRELEEEDDLEDVREWFAKGKERARQLDKEAQYEQDDGPLTTDQINQLKESVKDFEGVRVPGGEWIQTGPEFDKPKTEGIDEWNRMIEAAEKAVATNTNPQPEVIEVTPPSEDYSITHTEDSVVIEDSAGTASIDVERPGDYLTPPEEPVKAVAMNAEYLKVGDQMVHYKAHDNSAKDAYDAVARHESSYVQNEEQQEGDTKWKEINSVSEDKYQEAAKRNQESK